MEVKITPPSAPADFGRHQIIQVGNIVDDTGFSNPQRGRVYSVKGICPTLDTFSGGGRETKIICEYKI